MYGIYLNTIEDMNSVAYALEQAREQSRFTFEIERMPGERCHIVKISNVRLRESKHYCGNHAGPCRVIPGFHKPHRKGRWLEGLDWVSFNDMVNDILDKLEIDCRRVQSSTCVIRRGRARCIKYTGSDGGEFDRFGMYADCIGKSVKAEYPAGTPGIEGWRR